MLCYKDIVIASVGESILKIHTTKCRRHKEIMAHKNSAAKRVEMYFIDSKSEDIA